MLLPRPVPSISSGVGPSQLPDLNLPAAEEDPGDPHDKKRAAEREVFRLELEKIKSQKEVLADLIGPLIEEESNKHPSIKTPPSPTEMVERLISQMGSQRAQEANAPNAARADFKHLKTWLTRAAQSAQDDGKGNMSIRNGIRTILLECYQNDNDN